MRYLIVEQQDGVVDIVGDEPSFEAAVESCLLKAENNGFLITNTERAELNDQLRSDKQYDDGGVTIRIVEKEDS